MYSSVFSAAILGMECHEVRVEADVSDGLPMFSMVGFVSSQVKEAQDRVKTALRNSGILLKPKKITVNLSPADIKKEGSAYDLPIAIGVLTSYGYIPQDNINQILIIGELSLGGEVLGVPGVLPMVKSGAARGYRACIVPEANKLEGAVVEGIKVIGVKSLAQTLEYLNGDLFSHSCHFDPNTWFSQEEETYGEDFKDINGQEGVKRAAEVAVSGLHNLLMIGPPGSGKSMIAKRIPSILPDLTLDESLEISSIYSIAGMLGDREVLLRKRPFRSPHHTISAQALAGGGRVPKPGEISLAHGGVLFLDELPEFSRNTLEILRQPIEDRQVCISRTAGSFVFPANAMIVAAMNPCKCGYYPDMGRCTCTMGEVHKYLGKLSQPLLDRMDVTVEAPGMEYEDLTSHCANESSETIRKRVRRAHETQRQRYQGTPFGKNGDLNVDGIKAYCPLGRGEEKLMRQAFEKLRLSARAYHKVIKVARTIADMEGEERIRENHVLEAICYRSVDKKNWV